MIDVVPCIGMQKDWKVIEERLNMVSGRTSWVQMDFADNTIVPNQTLMDFAACKPFAGAFSMEAHLLVAQPEKFIKPASDAGFRRLIAHVEAHDLRLFLDQVKFEEVEVGVAIDGPTEFEEVEPFLEEADFVLVMTAEAGASGGTFLPECVEKIKSIHSYLPDLPIEVEGGITDVTARLVREAGATRLVATNYIFADHAGVSSAIVRLQNS
jgi:ribulose-phosphate 3-epimerase